MMEENTMEQTIVKRNYKDSLFRALFCGKKELLELYNALNGTHYTNTEDVRIEELENALYMNVKNDVSFIFCSELNLYEHQSTVNPNMPLRNLIYISDLIKRIIANEDIYGSKKIRIPEPRFVVFYNGTEKQDDDIIYKLSNLYEKGSSHHNLELCVKVLNINAGHNEKIVKASKTLHDYTSFIAMSRENLKRMDPNEAVDTAVRDCIKQNILKEFLLKNRAEVISMWLYEYDEEKHLKNVHNEGVEEGFEKGREEVRSEIRNNIIKNIMERDPSISKEEAEKQADALMS